MSEDWQRTGPHSLERGPWIIGKYLVQGVARYALWHGNANCGYFSSAAEAMAASLTAATDTSPTRISSSSQADSGIGVRP